MKTVKLKNISFRIYTEAHEVPIENYHLMHKYSLLASGIGSGKDIALRFQRLLTYLGKEDIKNASEETNNLMAAYYLSVEGINPNSLSLCCLVHSIEGVVIGDYSQENLSIVLGRLSKAGLSNVQLSDLLDEVKKNFNEQLALKFPKWFKDGEEDFYLGQTLRWIYISCDKLLDEEVNEKELELIEKYFYDLNQPRNFDPEDPLSSVNKHDKNFEMVCANLQKQISPKVRGLDVVEFYSLLETFEKKPNSSV